MTKFEALDQLVSAGKGYLLTADAVNSGISKHTLDEYVKAKNMERMAHGVYITEDTWPDALYLLYLRNKKIVFSFETALDLHDLADRAPFYITVTVPNGYNDTHLRRAGIRVVHTKPEWYSMGIVSVRTHFGNLVPAYDMDRTICDIIRCKKHIEIQAFQTALNEYMRCKRKHINNLSRYAAALGIADKVRIYTEVML